MFSLDEVVEFVAWWEQAYLYFFLYTVGVQSNHVDPVIIRIHVNTLMLVCGLLVVLLDPGKEIDLVVFSPFCWSQLLHKHYYPYFPCAIPVFVTVAEVTQHGVGNIHCFCLFQRNVVNWGSAWYCFICWDCFTDQYPVTLYFQSFHQ